MTGRVSVLLVFSALSACMGDPGSSRITVFAAADGERLWSRTLSTQTFDVWSSQAPDALTVQGYDNCPGAHFDRDYALEDGKLLSSRTTGPSEGVFVPTVYDPPSPCPTGVRRRYTLGEDRIVDACGGVELTLLDVKGGQVLLELAEVGYFEPYEVGVLAAIGGDFTLFAPDGTRRWSWPTPSSYAHPIGADAERIYMLSSEAGQLLALAASDGSSAWQVEPGCEWASYASGVVVCGRVIRKSSCEGGD